VVAPDETVIRVAIAELCKRDQEPIIDLRFRVRGVGDSGHEQILSGGLPRGQTPICSVAHSSPGAKAMYV